MLTIEQIDIFNKEKINIGKKYKIIGEIRYGIDENKMEELSSLLLDVEQNYLADVIVFDLIELQRWDSLGIRAFIPTLLELNKILAQKGRVLISIIGDINSDIYAAAKDKHPDISETSLPWYSCFDSFMDVVLDE